MKTFLVGVTAAGVIAATSTTLFTQSPNIEGVWLGTSTEIIEGPNPSKNPKRLHNIHIYTKNYWMIIAQDAAVPLPARKRLAAAENARKADRRGKARGL